MFSSVSNVYLFHTHTHRERESILSIQLMSFGLMEVTPVSFRTFEVRAEFLTQCHLHFMRFSKATTFKEGKKLRMREANQLIPNKVDPV